MKRWVVAMTCMAGASLAAGGGDQEGLAVTPPGGFKVANQVQRAGLRMTEWVRDGQTLDQWSELLTTMAFTGPSAGDPAGFRARMLRQWQQRCPGTRLEPVAEGAEGGTPFALWMLQCDAAPPTSRPEWTWFKAMQGRQGLYVVQVALPSAPDRATAIRWLHVLRHAQVCTVGGADPAMAPAGRGAPVSGRRCSD